MGRTKSSSMQAVLAAFCLLTALISACPLRADVALLMEEPFGRFGAFNPTGHAAIYLSDICAETPTRLRRCEPGEYGVVISRYHKINHLDWLAIPLPAYLYAVESADSIPPTADKAYVASARDAYWRAHLQDLAPPAENGSSPEGEWTQLVGASFDRKIYGFSMDTTAEQDDRFIAILNDRRNVSHFNLFFHNCADFARIALDMYYPSAIHRNFFADFGMTTPKQAAHSLLKFGREHPELHPVIFEIPQVPGTIPRSHRVDGIAESLVKSKKYLIPLAFLLPHVTGALAIDYLTMGRSHLPREATAFSIQEWRVSEPKPSTQSSGEAADPPATSGS